MGIGPSFDAWIPSSGIKSFKKTDSPLPSAEKDFMSTSSSHAQIWAGLVMLRACACSPSSCEFMCDDAAYAWQHYSTEDVNHLWLLQSLYPSSSMILEIWGQ